MTKQAERESRIAALGFNYEAQDKTAILPCNLCQADSWTVVAHRDRYGFYVQATSCDTCGLTTLNPRMSAAAYGRFYDGVYRSLVSAYHGRQIDASSIKLEQRQYASEIDQLLAPFLQKRTGLSLLDVGGSTGVVAAHFARRFGVKPVVLDPAPAEIAEARLLGIETISALVEDWDPGSRHFDVVVMFQTVDHLLDVHATLSKLRGIISEDGLFVVDIVDFRAAYLKHWSIESALKIDHPYSLMEETMEAFLARSGFKPIRKAYSADKHHVAYVCRPVCPKPDLLPATDWVKQYRAELRFVQNTPRTEGHLTA